jgi:hypothetical protein
VFSSRFSRAGRGGLVAAAALSIAAATAPAGALAAGDDPLVDFPTFSGASQNLDRNGTADILTSPLPNKQRILRMTAGGFRQTGSAWALPKVDLTRSFETTFKAYLHHGAPGADGIALLVQAEGPRALGGWGGGLGYRGIKRSVAIEFDTFQNTPDPSSNHLAVVLGGNPDNHMAVAEPSIPLYGKPFLARVTYDASTYALKIYVKAFRSGEALQLALATTVDLADEVNASSAWIGFTAATGTALSKQDIYSWSVDGSEA